ncbi:MAG: ATP-binding cassette domain-containing protein [Acidimicrobiia bacterium]|nr:ATP-binding cassette domain-containing protein [Acidimicrobiia bacterium]
MLKIRDLHAGYGYAKVLFGVSIFVGDGEIVTLLGRNGMGKSTTVKTIFGLLPATQGSILFRDNEILGRKPHQIARAGLGLVPEGREVFPLLTVDQNLAAMERQGASGSLIWDRGRVYEFFPQLADRMDLRADHLSGGEQQMLSIGRALVMNPDLLVLDEATEGLAPSIRAEIWVRLAELRDQGQSMLVIDGHVTEVLDLADRASILVKGEITWDGTAAELIADQDTRRMHLGVG